MREESIPLLSAWRTMERRAGRRKAFLLPCPLVTTGPQANSSWPPALPACWQALGEEGGREEGREAAGAQPYLDGRFLAALLGFFSLQSPPFPPSLCPWCVSLPAVPL